MKSIFSYLPSYKDWYASNYHETDESDHSERVVSFFDFTASFYKISEGFCKVSVTFVKVVSGIALSILISLPVVSTYCLSMKPFELLRKSYSNITGETWKCVQDFCNNCFIFLKETLPSNLCRGVGNGIGIFLPEVGRAVRQRSLSSFDKQEFWKEFDSNDTFYQRWNISTYSVDKQDHSGRLICLVDFASQLFRSVQMVGKLAWGVLKGFGALIVTVYMLPITAVAYCFKNEYASVWRGYHYKVVEYMGSSFMKMPCKVLLFLAKLALKAVGNMIGIIIPEMGRYVRTVELLQTPLVSYEVITEPLLDYLNGSRKAETDTEEAL